MKGFHPTPAAIVDRMVSKLFSERQPTPDSTVLDPGCGNGAFIEGLLRWCRRHRVAPRIIGVELNPTLVAEARRKFADSPNVTIIHADFLKLSRGQVDFAIGNPPYVPITSLSETEKTAYRDRFTSAVGRFDLYLLFFEKVLGLLSARGRAVLVTPEKFLYVETAAPLRTMMARRHVEELDFLREDSFPGLVTYPLITTISTGHGTTTVRTRDYTVRKVTLPTDGDSWLEALSGSNDEHLGQRLEDVCIRISCGTATGADGVFVFKREELPSELQRYAHPTIAGRQLRLGNEKVESTDVMLVPYDRHGRLADPRDLGALWKYVNQAEVRKRLEARTCAKKKPWYAFHETPRLAEVLQPKILAKDIVEAPHFWADMSGKFLPRHTLYYILPKRPEMIEPLLHYLNSKEARSWLETHCQRAAKGFYRVQSNVLKRLPIPKEIAELALAPVPRATRKG